MRLVLRNPNFVRPSSTEMETTKKEVLHAKALRKQVRTSVTVAEFLQDCGQLLTDVEYSLVDNTSKADTESAVDKLFEILLSKEEDFDAICSALRVNGYEEMLTRLKEEANAKKSLNVAPRNYKLLVKVEQARNEPPKTESSPTGRFSEGTEGHSWDKGTYLVCVTCCE